MLVLRKIPKLLPRIAILAPFAGITSPSSFEKALEAELKIVTSYRPDANFDGKPAKSKGNQGTTPLWSPVHGPVEGPVGGPVEGARRTLETIRDQRKRQHYYKRLSENTMKLR